MKLINTNEQLLKKYQKMDKTCLYLTLVPYKNNSCIKAYSDDGEPVGDIEPAFLSEYLNKKNVVMFVNEIFNDDTGLFELVVTTII